MGETEGWQLRLPETDGTKEERFHKVAAVVASLVLRSGKDGLRVSTVARRSGVSRAWIYKYFGSDPSALLDFAIRLYGEAFSDLGAKRTSQDVAEWRAIIAEATRKGLRDTLVAPWCVQVYLRHRHSADEIGAAIRELEERHVERFLQDMPARLRQDRGAARRFVEFFTGTRLGIFHRWLDPVVRARTEEDDAVTEILRPLDHFIAAHPERRP